MAYLAAVVEAIDECATAPPADRTVVRDGVELVVRGWRLHGPSTRWDVLGTAAQCVSDELRDLPPVAYVVDATLDEDEAWRFTVRLVEAVAGQLDRVAAADAARAWWAATAAARLRAALVVSP